MSKVQLKKPAESVQTNGQSEHKKKKKPENNKKIFFYDTKTAVKKKTKATSVKPTITPPTQAEEYSCNWKKLLQVRIIYHGKLILNSCISKSQWEIHVSCFYIVCVCVCV